MARRVLTGREFSRRLRWWALVAMALGAVVAALGAVLVFLLARGQPKIAPTASTSRSTSAVSL